MTWSMHPGQRYDGAQSRWHAPPPVKDGQPVHIDAPTAGTLVADPEPDRSRQR